MIKFYLPVFTDWDMGRVLQSGCLISVFIKALGVLNSLSLKIEVALDVWSVEPREILVDVPFELGVA